MAINKDTHVNASVILPIDVYLQVRQRAQQNGRSASKEMAKVITESLEANNYGMDICRTKNRSSRSV